LAGVVFTTYAVYKKGKSIDTIAEFTELSTEQIIKILKDYGLIQVDIK